MFCSNIITMLWWMFFFEFPSFSFCARWTRCSCICWLFKKGFRKWSWKNPWKVAKSKFTGDILKQICSWKFKVPMMKSSRGEVVECSNHHSKTPVKCRKLQWRVNENNSMSGLVVFIVTLSLTSIIQPLENSHYVLKSTVMQIM